jgi:hypothetical protein
MVDFLARRVATKLEVVTDSEWLTRGRERFHSIDIYVEEVGGADEHLFPEIDRDFEWPEAWKVTVVLRPSAKTVVRELYPERWRALAKAHDLEELLGKVRSSIEVRRHFQPAKNY